MSPANGHSTWNAKPGLSAAGDAAVGWLEGHTMAVARKPVDGAWQPPEPLSGSQSAYYPALAMDAGGNLLAAWQVLDAGNVGSGVVPVAVGNGDAVAGWATPHGSNPNAADLMADAWR